MWKISSFANIASLAKANSITTTHSFHKVQFLNSSVSSPVNNQIGGLIVWTRSFATPKKKAEEKPAGL
jgi:hypothetical protein